MSNDASQSSREQPLRITWTDGKSVQSSLVEGSPSSSAEQNILNALGSMAHGAGELLYEQIASDPELKSVTAELASIPWWRPIKRRLLAERTRLLRSLAFERAIGGLAGNLEILGLDSKGPNTL